VGGLVRAAAHRGERDGAWTTKKYNQMIFISYNYSFRWYRYKYRAFYKGTMRKRAEVSAMMTVCRKKVRES